jgi:hypothetical protein
MKKISTSIGLFILACSLFAQETTSEILGKIADEKGEALQGASIIATYLPTGTRYATESRRDGQYNITNMRVGGPYEIKVSYVGFEQGMQSDISLALGNAYKLDFILQPRGGGLTEVVVKVIKGDKIFVKTRTGSAEFINRQQLDRLPTVNRNIQDFTKLAPSANGNSFAGRSAAYNNFTVNGASFNNTFGLAPSLGGQTNAQPISLDALDQIQINIAPYDVTLANFTGSSINSVTKSGSNEFKFSIYNYFKTPDLTGTKIDTVSIPKQDFNFANRGISISGPLIKKKLFLFVNAEQERIDQPATTLLASRNGSFGLNISQAKAEDLQALSNFLKTRYNYNTGPFEKYNYKTYSDKITTRLDWAINKRNNFNINYYYLKSYRNTPPSNSGAPANNRQPSATAMPFFASSFTVNNNFNIVIAELNTHFSDEFYNKLQVGYNRLRDFRSSPGGVFPLVDIENGASQTFTSFGYEPFSAFNQLSTDTWQFNDIFTWYNGNHTLIFGTQNTYNRFKNGFAANYYGAYRFNSLQDFYKSVNKGDSNATRYELRYSTKKDGSFPFANVNTLQLGLFGQDRWAVSDLLTITVGLRADFHVFGDNFSTNPVADSLTFREGVKIKTGEAPKRNLLLSPRFGFNIDVDGTKNTQIRGGFGIFSGPTPFVWLSNQASNNGVDFGSFVTSNVPFNPNVNAYRPQPNNANANSSYNLAVTSNNFKLPQIFRSSIAIDQKLPGGIIATLEGIYTKDIRAVYHQNINLPASNKHFLGADNRIYFDSSRIYGSIPGGNTLTSPDISDAILMTNSANGYSYNISLQLQRNINNFYTMVAYNYGKTMSIIDGGSIAQTIWRDRYISGDPNDDALSYAQVYQPHRVVAAAFYRKEYGKHFATSIGFTFEAANGGTASYTYAGDLNRDGLVNNDLIYIPRNVSEIVLEKVGGSDTRLPSVIWRQLDDYINQDPYLKTRRGKYAERNGLLLPFYKKLDLNFTQDVFVQVNGKKNTLRFTIDIFNFGNLLNKSWSILQTVNRPTLLTLKRIDVNGPDLVPVFSFPYLDQTNKIPLSTSFINSTGPASRYQVQLGVRYIFN